VSKLQLTGAVLTNLLAAMVLLFCGILLGWHLGVTKGHMVVKNRGYAEYHPKSGKLVWVDDGTLVRDSK
jgi:hypothetical protein